MPRRRNVVLNFSETTKRRFAEEYLLDCDPVAAAERCSLQAVDGRYLLARSDVQSKIRFARHRSQSHTEIYADAVFKRWWQLATADPRELISVFRVNCRHCHGIDHRYQYTVDELRTARQSHEIEQRRKSDRDRVEFDDLGGDGFDPWGEPHPNCTECGGRGLSQVWVADTRHLSPAAALLYDGVELSRDGSMRIKMRDRGFAEQIIAAKYGFSIRGGSGRDAPLNPEHMSDEQLELAINAFRRAGVLDGDDEYKEGVIADAGTTS